MLARENFAETPVVRGPCTKLMPSTTRKSNELNCRTVLNDPRQSSSLLGGIETLVVNHKMIHSSNSTRVMLPKGKNKVRYCRHDLSTTSCIVYGHVRSLAAKLVYRRATIVSNQADRQEQYTCGIFSFNIEGAFAYRLFLEIVFLRQLDRLECVAEVSTLCVDVSALV